MILQELLGSVPAAQFLAEHYLKLPFSLPGGCQRLQALVDHAAIERILAQQDADVLVGRQDSHLVDRRPANLEEARSLLAEGYMIGIRHAERHDPALDALAARFSADFLGPTDIHLYWTPADSPGFGWHYDAEDVWVLQLAGDKEWWLRKNTVNPWPVVETLPRDMRYDREIMPVMRCRLLAGDWLYIPGGYWHRTQAGGESISLSVGVMPPTALDLFDFLRKKLVDALRWRQRLPLPEHLSADADLAQQPGQLTSELANELATLLTNDPFMQEFWEARRASLAGRKSE